PDVQFIGFNSQLSRVAVRLNAGRSYSLFIGGSRLDAESVRIGSTSGLISVAAGSIVEHSRDENLSVLRFEVAIAPETPPGDYSLYIEAFGGGTTVLVGVLTIEEFLNPWINYSLY
ncbi:MAG: hypothetical protein H0V76_12870, partial [Blastocatellia bacterium]|nr:hypothetical protein [Blastocatellia bacterium]